MILLYQNQQLVINATAKFSIVKQTKCRCLSATNSILYSFSIIENKDA